MTISSPVKAHAAIIYTRVSGNEQAAHGTSLESQRDACRAKAQALALPIFEEYEDAGISGGFLLSRAGMQAALADLQAGRADTLICASISRYSRDTEHQQSIKKAVQAAGGRLVFCDMDFDDTPEGDLAFGIMGNFAEYERKSIATRTEKGRRKRAEQGQQPARARAPYGYHVVGKADVLRGDHPADLRGQYLVIEPEAEIVRAMFDRYASGTNTLSGLARWLNENGILPRHTAIHWAVTSLHSILSNPIYKGEASYGRHVHTRDEARIGQINPHTGRPIKTCHQQRKAAPGTYLTWPAPAIVSEEVWDAVQAKFKQNVAGCSGNPKRLRMLAGRITCPTCGGGMTVYQRGKRNKDQKPYPCNILFQCTHFRWQKQNTGTDACDKATYRVDVVEGAVLTSLEHAATNPDVVRAAQKALSDARAGKKDTKQIDKSDDPAQQLAQVEGELSMLTVKQEAAIKAQIAGIMAGAEPSAYAAVFGEISERRSALEARRVALTQGVMNQQKAGRARKQKSSKNDYDFPHLLADLHRVLTSEDVPGDRKRDIIGTVIEKVYPEKDGARVVFLPGVFEEPGDGGADGTGTDTLQPNTYRSIPQRV